MIVKFFILLSICAASAFAQSSTNTVNPRDYAAFRIIAERNIFNPNRTARGSGAPKPEPKAAKVDSFSLLGTMSYEKGKFAFFDGSSSEFRKVLSPSGSIAGYTLVDVGETGVKLEKEGQTVDLPVGSQMKRQDEGAWMVSAGSPIVSSSPSDSTSGQTSENGTSPAADSDVLKRLLEKREKESKK